MSELPEQPIGDQTGETRRVEDRRQRHSAIDFADRRTGARRDGKNRRSSPRS